MVMQAQVPDGTTLEFPDGTDPAVIQKTVKRHLGIAIPEESPAPWSPSPVGGPTPDPLGAPSTLGGSLLQTPTSPGEVGSPLVPPESSPSLSPLPSQFTSPIGTTRHQGMVDEAVRYGLGDLQGTPGGMLGLVGNAVPLVARYLGNKIGFTPPEWLARVQQPPLPTPDQFHDEYRAQGLLDNPDYAPETSGEKFLSRGIRGAVSSPFGGAGIAYGALGQLGGEAAAQTLGEGWRIAGQIATPLGAMAVKRLFQATPDTQVHTALRGLNDDQAAAALKLYDDAQAMGRPVTVAEAVSKVTGGNNRLQAMQRYAEQSPGGSAVLDPMMNARGVANERGIGSDLEGFGLSQPAQPQLVAGRVSDAATQSINAAERGVTSRTAPFYRAAGRQTVPAPQMESILSDIDAAIAADKTGALNAPLSKVRDLFTETPASALVPRTPITDIENLDRARKYIRDTMLDQNRGMPTPGQIPIDKETSAKISGILKNVNSLMESEVPTFAVAKQRFAQLTQQNVTPLREGTMGDLAAVGETGTAESRFNSVASALFPKDPKTLTPETVTKTIGELNLRDTTAARDMTRVYLESAFNKSVGDAAQNPSVAGGSFRKMIVGNPEQAANLEAAVKALPNGEQAWRGFDRLLDVFEAQGKRLPANSATEFNRMTGEAMKPGIPQAVVKPLGALQGFVDKVMIGRNTERLAEILTDRSTLADLGRLRMLNPGSNEAALLASQIVTNSPSGRPSGE